MGSYITDEQVAALRVVCDRYINEGYTRDRTYVELEALWSLLTNLKFCRGCGVSNIGHDLDSQNECQPCAEKHQREDEAELRERQSEYARSRL